MKTPVFFFGFANNMLDPLPNLEREADNIHRLLEPAVDQDRIKVHREQFATVEKLSRFLLSHPDRITLFHYGGHANSRQIILGDAAANSEGVALQLAGQKNLKLVFLNGCSTRPQVQFLLDQGVPAVIATSVPVNDVRATEFAEYFYTAITSGHSIGEAFEKAAAVVRTGSEELPRIYRALYRGESDPEVLPWGLYTRSDKVLGEKLIPEPVRDRSEKNVVRNQELNIDGDAHIGDEGPEPDKRVYDKKNVMEGGKTTVKGNFRLGDNYSK